MDISNFMDELHISEEIKEDNFFNSSMQDLPQEEIKKEEKISSYKFNGWKKIFSKMLMQGFHSKEIKARFKTNIKVASLTEDVDKFLKSKDGLVGTLFVDCSCFDDKFKYKDVNAKYKQYNRFAINCSCKKNFVISKIRKYASEGSIDGVLNNKENLIVKKREICPECGLIVIHSLKDIPLEVLKEVVDLLVSNNEISYKLGESIKNSSNILSNLRNVFSKMGLIKIKNTPTKVDNITKDFSLKEEKLETGVINQGKELVINPLKEDTIIKNELIIDDLMNKQEVNSLSENNGELEGFGFNNLDYCLVDDMNNKDNELIEIDMISPQVVDVNDLKEVETDDIGEIVKNDIEVENKNDEVLDIDVYAKPSAIEVDNDEYVDSEYFEKNDIEFDESEFYKTKDDLKISNKYSFDF